MCAAAVYRPRATYLVCVWHQDKPERDFKTLVCIARILLVGAGGVHNRACSPLQVAQPRHIEGTLRVPIRTLCRRVALGQTQQQRVVRMEMTQRAEIPGN